MNDSKLQQLARAVIETEAKAITDLSERIGPEFLEACHLMYDCKGRIVVLGMGKSGHIGDKIAATLASTGSPAFFVHPGEASHGDMGMITRDDVVMALSNSGETSELLTILPLIKRLGVPLIALTGNPKSTLARSADAHIDVSVEKEACPLGLAPTSSTTAALVMGDALAISLLERRGFTADDFALSHPGGALGRRLLLHVEDIMHSGENIPLVSITANLSEALLEMTKKGLGMTGIVDEEGNMTGIFTDGDLRRVLDHGEVNVHETNIADVMTRNCKSAHPHQLAVETLRMMEKFKINSLLVVDNNNKPVGAMNMHDLLRAGVV
jgi:arabinose-5-phosphate isomerase